MHLTWRGGLYSCYWAIAIRAIRLAIVGVAVLREELGDVVRRRIVLLSIPIETSQMYAS